MEKPHNDIIEKVIVGATIVSMVFAQCVNSMTEKTRDKVEQTVSIKKQDQ